jgi:hypothetical protein
VTSTASRGFVRRSNDDQQQGLPVQAQVRGEVREQN